MDGRVSALPADGELERTFGVTGLNLTRAFTFELNSDPAIADTVRLMDNHARISARSAVVAHTAAVLRRITETDTARAIFYHVKGRVRFVEDATLSPLLAGAEVLIAPDLMLSMPDPRGDCDDYAMLTASLLQAVGITWWYVTVAGNPDYPGMFTHIYTACMADGARYAMDASHMSMFGEEVGDGLISRKVEWIGIV